MAFGHGAKCLIELEGTVGTCPLTVAAAHTFSVVDQHDPIMTFIDSLSGADIAADRIFAVVAGKGKVIGGYIRDPGFAVLFPFPPGNFIYPAPQQAYIKIMFILAGYLAGFTS
jgi:hypothetical protein